MAKQRLRITVPYPSPRSTWATGYAERVWLGGHHPEDRQALLHRRRRAGAVPGRRDGGLPVVGQVASIRRRDGPRRRGPAPPRQRRGDDPLRRRRPGLRRGRGLWRGRGREPAGDQQLQQDRLDGRGPDPGRPREEVPGHEGGDRAARCRLSQEGRGARDQAGSPRPGAERGQNGARRDHPRGQLGAAHRGRGHPRGPREAGREGQRGGWHRVRARHDGALQPLLGADRHR